MYLTLPEEFVLLSYRDSGETPDGTRTASGCAAAELAELALRRRLLASGGKSRLFGLQVVRTSNAKIQLLDSRPTGLGWADELLADLAARPGSKPRPPVHRWLRERSWAAFVLHRDALVARGLLVRGHSKVLRAERHYPQAAHRDALINEIHAAYGGHRPLDERLLFLCDLMGGAGLGPALGLTMDRRLRMEWARGIGRVAAFPEDLRDTSTLLGALIRGRDPGSPGSAAGTTV